MKPYTASLATFLASATTCAYADLYTVTLVGGAVYRWCSADIPITYGGYTFSVGPVIWDLGTQTQRGLQVDTIDVVIADVGATLIGSVPLLTFIRVAGFDGATIRVDRVFAADWSSALQGGYLRFSGRVSEVKELTKTGATLGCSSWLELLNVKMPTNIISTSCMNVLYGTACGLNKAAYAASGTVGSGTNGATTFSSNLTSHGADYFDLGYIVFTSGVNNGASKTIKTQDASGNLTVLTPLGAAPAAGDTFTAYPGCPLSQAVCQSKFNNLGNFRGFPYVPPPELAI